MKYSKKTLFILAVCILAIAFFAKELCYKNIQAGSRSIRNMVFGSNTVLINSLAPISWKKYTNEKYNYSIMYPENWYINTEFSNQGFTLRGSANTYIGGDTSISNYSDEYLRNYQNTYGFSTIPKDYLSINLAFFKSNPTTTVAGFIDSTENKISPPLFEKEEEQNVVLNGMPGIEQKIIGKIGIGDSTRPNSRGVILKKQDKIVTIGYNFDDSLGAVTPVADEILSSFAIK